ncbi:hypothetical protein [Streptomyces sp. NPDC060035]|uniref:hypothetical protein n=1 Tax=Streptomyces sp. NPDC060035 TaxID=3347044 RepID=UPI0036B1B97C
MDAANHALARQFRVTAGGDLLAGGVGDVDTAGAEDDQDVFGATLGTTLSTAFFAAWEAFATYASEN